MGLNFVRSRGQLFRLCGLGAFPGAGCSESSCPLLVGISDANYTEPVILNRSEDENRVAIEGFRVIYRGQVQGVGFRFNAVRQARQFAVSGFVRNRSDGSVELIAEGEGNEIQEFLVAVKQSMSRQIEDVEIEPRDVFAYSGFEIRY